MFLNDDSFDLGLLGNIMFEFLPSMFPKSLLHIEKAAFCSSCFAEEAPACARIQSFTALGTLEKCMRNDWCNMTAGD